MPEGIKREERLRPLVSKGVPSEFSCPVCETHFFSESEPSFRIRNYLYRRCANCLSFVLDPLPSEKELENFYGSPGYYPDLYGDYYFESAGARYRNFKKWWGHVEPFILEKRARLVELGTGAGTFLQVLLDSGYTNVAGYEMNPVALQRAQKKDLPVFAQDLFAREEGVAVLFLFDVIEHVTDPVVFLKSVSRALHPGGYLVLGTSCNRRFVSRMLGRFWWFLIPPNHVIIYNIKSLEGLLFRLNFRVIQSVKINYHWISLTNSLAKIRNRFPALHFEMALQEPSKEPMFPFFHFTSFLTIARKLD